MTRWDSESVAMVYCSESIALAVLETPVHLGTSSLSLTLPFPEVHNSLKFARHHIALLTDKQIALNHRAIKLTASTSCNTQASF